MSDEREMCVHCGRHPTAFQEVQALREELWRTTTAAAEELATLQDQVEEMRLNFDGNLTAMGHPPHPNCKFRRLLEEVGRSWS